MSTTETQDIKEFLARELERSRGRSLGLTTEVLDDAELTAQHSRLMSPLVWDLAHVGNYEELWLLRATSGATVTPSGDRPPVRRLRAPARHPAQSPAAEPGRVAGLPRPGPSPGARHPRPRTAGRRGAVAGLGFRLSDGAPARAPARRDDAGHPPAASRCPRPAGHRVRPAPASEPLAGGGAGAGGVVRDGHLDGPVGAGQRATRPPGRPARVLPGHHTGVERRLPRLRRVRRLRRRTPVEPGRLAVALPLREAQSGLLGQGLRQLAASTARHPRAAAGRRARAARVLLRGRRLRPLRRSPTAHRGGVGEGGVLGPGHRDQATPPLG